MTPPIILFEDAWCVCVNKPTNMASVDLPNSPLRSVESAFAGWLAVHRLDNDTTGCLLMAKTREAFAQLRALFEYEQIEKLYRARVDGFTPASGEITTPIGHHKTNARRMVIAAGPQPAIRGAPQPAHTRYATVAHLPASAKYPLPSSLIDVWIHTGVRHQIRVHCASIGHPLVGDALYGAKAGASSSPTFTHHLLLAWRLRFLHPWTGVEIIVQAPLPEYLQIGDTSKL